MFQLVAHWVAILFGYLYMAAAKTVAVEVGILILAPFVIRMLDRGWFTLPVLAPVVELVPTQENRHAPLRWCVVALGAVVGVTYWAGSVDQSAPGAAYMLICLFASVIAAATPL